MIDLALGALVCRDVARKAKKQGKSYAKAFLLSMVLVFGMEIVVVVMLVSGGGNPSLLTLVIGAAIGWTVGSLLAHAVYANPETSSADSNEQN